MRKSTAKLGLIAFLLPAFGTIALAVNKTMGSYLLPIISLVSFILISITYSRTIQDFEYLYKNQFKDLSQYYIERTELKKAVVYFISGSIITILVVGLAFFLLLKSTKPVILYGRVIDFRIDTSSGYFGASVFLFIGAFISAVFSVVGFYNINRIVSYYTKISLFKKAAQIYLFALLVMPFILGFIFGLGIIKPSEDALTIISFITINIPMFVGFVMFIVAFASVPDDELQPSPGRSHLSDSFVTSPPSHFSPSFEGSEPSDFSPNPLHRQPSPSGSPQPVTGEASSSTSQSSKSEGGEGHPNGSDDI